MEVEGAHNAVITDLRRRLATAQFDVSMTKDKVQAIVWRHRINTLKLIDESLEKGWKLWSAQAAKLQLLHADRDNQKVHGPGFFKMPQAKIDTLQEEIAKDIYEIMAFLQRRN